jgi:hypothetical protein
MGEESLIRLQVVTGRPQSRVDRKEKVEGDTRHVRRNDESTLLQSSYSRCDCALKGENFDKGGGGGRFAVGKGCSGDNWIDTWKGEEPATFSDDKNAMGP